MIVPNAEFVVGSCVFGPLDPFSGRGRRVRDISFVGDVLASEKTSDHAQIERDSLTDDDDPVFRLVTPKGVVSASRGTRVYAFGREIKMVVSVETATIVDGPEEPVRTKITITLLGTQVVTECVD
jgi:hypothetical protein